MILSHRYTSALALLAIFAPTATRISALSTATPKTITNKNVPGLKNGMDYMNLGSSDLEVSRVCMGTMTFGEVSK
jgi:hypothetical protein